MRMKLKRKTDQNERKETGKTETRLNKINLSSNLAAPAQNYTLKCYSGS